MSYDGDALYLHGAVVVDVPDYDGDALYVHGNVSRLPEPAGVHYVFENTGVALQPPVEDGVHYVFENTTVLALWRAFTGYVGAWFKPYYGVHYVYEFTVEPQIPQYPADDQYPDDDLYPGGT